MSDPLMFTDAEFGISGNITATFNNATRTVTYDSGNLQAYVSEDVSGSLTFTGTDFEFTVVSRDTPLVGLTSLNNNVKVAAEAVVQAYRDALYTIWHTYDASGEFYCVSGTNISVALNNLTTALNTQATLVLKDDLCGSPVADDYFNAGDIGTAGGWNYASLVASKSIAFSLNGTTKLLGLESGSASTTTPLVQGDYPNIVNAIKDTSSRGEAGSGLSGEDKFDEFEKYTNAIPISLTINTNRVSIRSISLDYTTISGETSTTVSVGTFSVINNAPGLITGGNQSYTLTSSALRSINYTTGQVSVSIAAAGDTNNFKANVDADFTISDDKAITDGVAGEVPNVTFDFTATLTYGGETHALGTLPTLTGGTELEADPGKTFVSAIIEVGLVKADRDTYTLANHLYKDPTLV